MGNLFGIFFNQEDIRYPTAIDHIYGPKPRRNCGGVCNRKRTLSSEEFRSASVLPDVETKRFKLSTLDYVYQKLFVENVNSDVVVHALGHTWKLHRLYLEQCDYFRALFHGNWSDSGKNEYTLEIEDENIDIRGLNNVFACLYNNEIEIDQEHIAGVCGAASMLSLTSVLDKCNLHLTEYINDRDKLLICLQLADRYGFEERLKEAYEHLKYMFFHFCHRDEEFLRRLDEQVLVKLLSSELLCVHENEFDLYMIIRKWITLREFPTAQSGSEGAAQQYCPPNFPSLIWRRYKCVLRHLRIAHLITLQRNLQVITNDRLIPEQLLDCVIKDQWNSMLKSEETTEIEDQIDDSIFYSSCYRLGRAGLDPYSRISWRWLGYFFGLDLLVNYDYGSLRLTRNRTLAPSHVSIKNVDALKLHYRCIICTEKGHMLLDTKRQTRIFASDRSIEIGAIKLPEKSISMSVYLFYLPFRPIRPPTEYWDKLEQELMAECLK